LKTKNVLRQIKDKIKNSEEFRKRINNIMNGQIILYIKHGKINTRRFIDDDNFNEKEDKINEGDVW